MPSTSSALDTATWTAPCLIYGTSAIGVGAPWFILRAFAADVVVWALATPRVEASSPPREGYLDGNSSTSPLFLYRSCVSAHVVAQRWHTEPGAIEASSVGAVCACMTMRPELSPPCCRGAVATSSRRCTTSRCASHPEWDDWSTPPRTSVRLHSDFRRTSDNAALPRPVHHPVSTTSESYHDPAK